MKKINARSLFDGMSCLQIALNDLGLNVENYYASEVDKHAVKMSSHLFENTIHLGDVTKWREWNIDWASIDIVGAGSPCQGFSFAGKQLAFNDPRSKLFFVFVEILNHIKTVNPNVLFLLENVKMKKEHELVITKYMGVAPIEINSASVSAQNRVRLYWTNIANEPYGLFGDLKCAIPQPKDRGILLKDILESDVPEKYFLSEKMLKYFENRAANFNQGKVNIREEEGKASCLTSSKASCDISDNFIAVDCNGNEGMDKSGTLLARYAKSASNFGSDTYIKVDTNLKKSANQDKANCFTAGGNSGGLHSDMTLIARSVGRNPENPKSRKKGEHLEQHLEPRYDGKTNCLTSVQKDNLVMSGTLRTHKDGQGFRKMKSGKGAAVTARAREDIRGQGVVQIGLQKIRRLTPRECGRLQTIPEPTLEKMLNSGISDTQLYRMFGNGWTIEVIKHILSHM